MKFTLQLIKLLDNKVAPESVVKFIYINVFQLMKEIKSKSVKRMDILNRLFDTYTEYYKTIINISAELWVRTIFPPYINGYKNFYCGIAGRLVFFSKDLNVVIEQLNNPDMDKYRAANIGSYTPDTYYWYGNPLNWSYCYEIKLNALKEIAIRKRQILILDYEYNVYEDLLDGKESFSDVSEILLLYRIDTEIEDLKPYPYPTRRFHITPYSKCNGSVGEDIENMIENYKTNVSKKNGYNIEIQKLWDEYNELKKIQFNYSRMRIPIKYINHKIMGEEEICELEKNFLTVYKEKIKRLKEKNKNC